MAALKKYEQSEREKKKTLRLYGSQADRRRVFLTLLTSTNISLWTLRTASQITYYDSSKN